VSVLDSVKGASLDLSRAEPGIAVAQGTRNRRPTVRLDCTLRPKTA
jgi:hypothetical protein